MLYRLSPPDATGGSTINGRHLAADLRQMDSTAKAFMAAEIYTGAVRVDQLTLHQVAALCGVSTTYVAAAKKVAGQHLLRAAVMRSDLSLMDADRALRTDHPQAPIDLVWEAASPVQQEAFVREHGDTLLNLLDVVTA